MREQSVGHSESLARRFREARGGLSREKAAAALKLSTATLGEIEAGRREPTVGQLRAAAGCYGLELRSLLFGRPPPDPALVQLGPDLAELLQEYMRERYGAERVDQLDEAQVRELEGVAAQARRLGGLVESLLRRSGGGPGPAEQLAALSDALLRIEHLLDQDEAEPASPAASGPMPVAGFRFEERSGEILRAHHAVFRDALDWHHRTGGEVAADEGGFQQILPWLQILVPTGRGFPYLHCGERTPPAELWGEALARSLVGRFHLPDGSLCRATAQAFLSVHRADRPLMQACGGPIVVEGAVRSEAWHRLVMPLQFRGLACVATLAVFDRYRCRKPH